MPRTARLLCENVFYHVMARGNQKQKIFINDKDYKTYFALLKKYKSRFDILLYGYCLMPNHVHLIVQPEKPSHLSHFMKSLNQTYAQYFNSKYNKCGHLWQGRFKSMVIENEGYVFDCIKYVEFNPVRSNLAKSPGGYFWSSYRLRVNEDKEDILDPIENVLLYK